MLLLTAVLDDGTPVGRLWLGLTHPRGTPDCAFVYDIEVAEDHRGSGLGRALLTAGGEGVRAHRLPAGGVNVFSGDARAPRVYRWAGDRVGPPQLGKDPIWSRAP